jgi:hypothetical protein
VIYSHVYKDADPAHSANGRFVATVKALVESLDLKAALLRRQEAWKEHHVDSSSAFHGRFREDFFHLILPESAFTLLYSALQNTSTLGLLAILCPFYLSTIAVPLTPSSSTTPFTPCLFLFLAQPASCSLLLSHPCATHPFTFFERRDCFARVSVHKGAASLRQIR